MPRETRLVPVAPDVSLAVDLWPGAAPGVLAVHGLASNAQLWWQVAAELAAAGHAVAAVDLRGHGRSSAPETGYDFETVTDDLLAVLDALERGTVAGADGPDGAENPSGARRDSGPGARRDGGDGAFGAGSAHGTDGAPSASGPAIGEGSPWALPILAGQSWGGNVVVELARRAPQRVGGVVCLDGGTIELSERFASWEECEAALAPPVLDGVSMARLEGILRSAHPDWPDAGIRATLANVVERPDGTVTARLSRAHHLQILHSLYEHHPSRCFPELRCGVLFLMAANGDAAWTADKRAGVERATRLLGSSLARWFEGADHDLHAQHPIEVAAAIEEAWAAGLLAPHAEARPWATTAPADLQPGEGRPVR